MSQNEGVSKLARSRFNNIKAQNKKYNLQLLLSGKTIVAYKNEG